MTIDQTDDDILTTDEVNEMLRDKTLTTLDRCDHCGAQAYVHVAIIDKPLTLMFCGHHWAPLEDNDTFTVLRDQRSSLLERPSYASLTDAL